MFPVTSRYHAVEIATCTMDEVRTVAYLRRRFLPALPMTLESEHLVVQGDRLDNLAAKYLGDPEQFWRVCDANPALLPDELTRVVGRQIGIPSLLG